MRLSEEQPPTPSTVLVGGVAQLYQGDLDLGRLAVEQLFDSESAPGVVVEDLHYGAVAVTQRLQDLRPGTLVLVGSCERGRQPGTLERRVVDPPELSTEQAQRAVEESITGYVSLDLIVEVAAALEAFPPRTIAIEVEPAATEPSDQLSREAADALPDLVEATRTEVRRVPVYDLADDLRRQRSEADLEPSPALTALDALLAELARFERDGQWGRVFAERDRLQACITTGQTGDDPSKLDWAWWWALIEALGRHQADEALRA